MDDDDDGSGKAATSKGAVVERSTEGAHMNVDVRCARLGTSMTRIDVESDADGSSVGSTHELLISGRISRNCLFSFLRDLLIALTDFVIAHADDTGGRGAKGLIVRLRRTRRRGCVSGRHIATRTLSVKWWSGIRVITNILQDAGGRRGTPQYLNLQKHLLCRREFHSVFRLIEHLRFLCVFSALIDIKC